MRYTTASKEHIEQIYELVQHTIQTVYPKYYPAEIVTFFCNHHTKQKIAVDIENGFVRVLFDLERLIGTGSCAENHITRLFVTPNLQKNGYGSYIMQRLEHELLDQKYNSVLLDASLAAACFYEHLGYKTLRHQELPTDNGVILVYEIMEKQLKAPLQP